MRPRKWGLLVGLSGLLCATGASCASAQQPASTDATATPQPAPATPPKSQPTKYSHANDFLIRGTVFTDKALAFPGVELQIRRVGDKKAHWNTYTNSRGEFAVRVPQGSNYELLVHTKGFTDQKRAIDAKNGMNEESLVFRMELLSGEKK